MATDRRMTRDDVLAAIDREWTRLSSAIDALGKKASTAPVTDEGWTAKDVLAHLVHWGVAAAYGLGASVEPPPYLVTERERRIAAGDPNPPMPSGEESNAMAVAHYREVPLEEMRDRLEALVGQIVEQVRSRTDEQMNSTDAIPWAPGRPLWHFVGGDTFLHWPVHAETIERAARR